MSWHFRFFFYQNSLKCKQVRIDKSKTKKNGAHTQLYRNSLARESFPSVYVFFFFSLHFIMDFNTDSLQVIALFSGKQLLRTNDSQLKIIAKTKHCWAKQKISLIQLISQRLFWEFTKITPTIIITNVKSNQSNHIDDIKPVDIFIRFSFSSIYRVYPTQICLFK